MPNGKLPVLEVNGQKISESYAILRFLARKFGLAGKTDLEQLKNDEIADLHKDFTNEIKPFFYTASGFREGDKSKLLDSIFLPAAGRYLGHLQHILEHNIDQLPICKKTCGTFLTGQMPSFVDFLVRIFHKFSIIFYRFGLPIIFTH
jgi:glutathione S-transferase